MRNVRLAAMGVGAGLVLLSPALAHAEQVTGHGKNTECQPDQEPNADGYCPQPTDPTAGMENLLGDAAAPLLLSAGESPGGGIGVAVAIGDEGVPGSVLRFSVTVADSGNTLGYYLEDYTDGDVIANIIHDVNGLLGCVLVGGGNTCQDATTDTGRFTL